MKRLRLFLIAASLILSSIANAVDFSVGVGITHSTLPPNGVWWQNGYDSSLPHNVSSLTARMDQRFGNWGLGLGYMYEGHFMSESKFVASDAAYAAGNRNYPISTGYGSQTNQMVFMAARRYIGDFYVEAGPAVSYAHFHMDVPNAYPTQTGSPYSVSFNSRTWTVQGYASAGYEFAKKWTLALSYIPANTGTAQGQIPGIAGSYSTNISVLYKF